MLFNRDYWQRVIKEIEYAAYLKSRGRRIKNYDLSVTLPETLRRRVNKVMPYGFENYDRNVFIDESTAGTPKSLGLADDSDDLAEKREKRKVAYNESTCSEIERLENEFVQFDMKIDVPVQRKAKIKKRVNWASKYICQGRRERVHWDSKIYHLEKKMNEKTLDEQAEQLMDASAERFTEWLNSLGSNHESDMSKAQLKALFSIEGDRRLLASIQTEPKEVKAIAKAVADKWNLPEMAIELKYENYIKGLLENVPKKVIKVAFGRTVAYKYRPWMPSDRDQPITSVFPNELLSGHKLFKGIGHLRSVTALLDFYNNHPQIEKPDYLVKSGLFKQKEITMTKQHIPLYELLKLKY